MACSPIYLVEELEFNRGLSDSKIDVLSSALTLSPPQFKYKITMKKREAFEFNIRSREYILIKGH